jgi:hypothetical protein
MYRIRRNNLLSYGVLVLVERLHDQEADPF